MKRVWQGVLIFVNVAALPALFWYIWRDEGPMVVLMLSLLVSSWGLLWWSATAHTLEHERLDEILAKRKAS